MSLKVVQKIINNDPEKSYLQKPDKILGALTTLSRKLYSNRDTCIESEKIDAFLEKIWLPKLSEEDSQALDQPFTNEIQMRR